jgi:hypothetical protein
MSSSSKKSSSPPEADQTQTASVRQCGTSASGGARRLKPLLSMTSYHRPAQMIRLRYCCFGATGYIIDADRSTLSFDPEALEGRLSTGYPVDLSRRSSKNEDGNLPLKKSSPGQIRRWRTEFA